MRYFFTLIGLMSLMPGLFAATTVQFTAQDVCQGSQTTFISTSSTTTGSITQFLWDLDNDGAFDDATGNTINYLFVNPGTYPVGLKIVVSNGDRDSIYQNVVINPVANADFTWNEVCDGVGMPLTTTSTISSGTITMFDWELNNNASFNDASGASINHQFPSYGSYPVSLRVTSDSGCVSTVTKDVLVNPNPTVDFTWNDVCIGDSMPFNASASVVTGSINSYTWDLNGDNVFPDATGQSIMHQYINASDYLVTVKAATVKGCVSSATHLVTVAPIPYISFEFDSSCVGVSVGFNNQSFSQVGSMDYTWDFGDGESSNTENASHTYQSAGTFPVTLVGTSSYGCVDSTTENITIYPTPESDFSFQDVCFGQTVSFVNNSKPLGSTIESYYWNFGDGDEAFVTNPTHDYATADSFDVYLVTYSTSGCRDTLTQTLNVWSLPNAEIVANGDVQFCDGFSVGLFVTADSTENILWSTADDDDSIFVTTSGLYHVLIYDEHNCKDRDTMEVVVWPLPTIGVNNDTTISLGFSVGLEATGAESYSWDPNVYLEFMDADANPTATPLETTTYTVWGSDTNGCINSNQVTINVVSDYSFVPYNLFSPNGDNVNDYFEIKNIQLYPDCEVIVYNRLGSKVYEGKAYANDWDGTYKGEPLPNATYYYIIKCDGTEQVLDGPVTILR